jgi:AraC family transcriptional activator of tynA and feaB
MLTSLSPTRIPLDRFHAELSNTCGNFDVVSAAHILERGIAVADRCFGHSDVSSQSIADLLDVSVRQLQCAFAMMGTTPTDYLLKKRMEKACQMLEVRSRQSNPALVSSIAYNCGFNDVSYFNRQFRRMFGCAPGQFIADPVTSDLKA